tara:strand:+ start:497 stop:643 length:147 start_codon:yes stop_codon:yes gene_type:complete
MKKVHKKINTIIKKLLIELYEPIKKTKIKDNENSIIINGAAIVEILLT